MDVIKDTMASGIQKALTIHINGGKWVWAIGIFFVILMIVFFSIAASDYSIYKQLPHGPGLLVNKRKNDLGLIDHLPQVNQSVCANLIRNTGAYSGIDASGNAAFIHWRPLTVRLAGYLGGDGNTSDDGVFDMDSGITHALNQGARAFVLEIDYLNDTPCVPIIANRDAAGYMRSFNTGSIQNACKAISDKAFSSNYDPIVVILYFRRVPEGAQQKSFYLTNTAQALAPLTPYFLTSANGTNFNNCANETQLITNKITDYQKKIIIMTNYDTKTLSDTSNPTDNLNFWTNCRIFKDDANYTDSDLGNVTPVKPTGTTPAAVVGSIDQYKNIPTASFANQNTKTANTFTICMASVKDSYTYTATILDNLFNILGIQCVPLDVINLSVKPEHLASLAGRSDPTNLWSLTRAQNLNDPLSFWTNAGYSKKYVIGEPSPTAAQYTQW